MKVLVVDDEPVARRRLIDLIAEVPGVEVTGEAADGVEALECIEVERPDAVLLDIRMPGVDGLSVAQSGGDLPPIIFVTAHDEFAIEAFEAEAVDYLLKPVERQRLEKALGRVRKRTEETKSGRLASLLERIGPSEPPRISAKLGDSMYLFDPREITRLRADAKYTCLTYEGKEYLLDENIGTLEAVLAPWGFFRVHRSELVNLARIRAFHGEGDGMEIELDDGQRAAVSRRRIGELKRRIGID
jgi:DNA-binding LytR/AlgR family response regulator